MEEKLQEQKVLNMIRQHRNLKMFRESYCQKFCAKHKIAQDRFHYLLSIVAVERLSKIKK